MKSGLCCVLMVVLFVVVYGGRPCKESSDCGQGECCQKPSRHPIASRRQVRMGTCEPYRTEGMSCDYFDRRNGYCGCIEGTRCTSHTDPNYSQDYERFKKDMMPGVSWRCSVV